MEQNQPNGRGTAIDARAVAVNRFGYGVGVGAGVGVPAGWIWDVASPEAPDSRSPPVPPEHVTVYVTMTDSPGLSLA
jgi:hypothetical protein